MATRTLAYPVNGIIHLDMDDHLTITGWDREEIEIKIRDESDLIIRQKDRKSGLRRKTTAFYPCRKPRR
jgi:hypothetical protein